MNRWLVYLISQCEVGTEGKSSWLYHCIAHGNTDKEIYNDWIKNVKKIYDVDLSKYLTCINGRWVPLRPENFKKYMLTFWERLYLAWEVFQCRAEAFKWPEGQ